MAEAEAQAPEGTETEAEGTEEQQTPEWQSAIEQLGDQLGSRFDEFADRFQQAPEPEQEPSYDDFGGVDPNDLYDDEGDMDPEAAQRLLAQMTGQQVEKAVGPLMEKIHRMEVQRGAERLEQEFPELQEPEVAQATLKAVDDYAAEIGRPDLREDPGFIRLVYLAQKSSERASQEVPAGTAADGLESASGAAAPAPEIDPAQRIVQAGRGDSFWGA